jgi:N-methylhydantoinase A/oxoprolinase/acetone carboxylase beta subunit
VTTARLGVDVGRASTNAVLLDPAGNLLARDSRPTTDDPLEGIHQVVGGVLAGAGGVTVTHTMVGTTSLMQAVLGRSGLGRVAVLRIGAPMTLAVPPFTDWARDVVDDVGGPVAVVRGGHEYDGRQIGALDVDAVHEFAANCENVVDGVAVVGVMSPVNAEHERRAAVILSEHLGNRIAITEGHEVGGMGLLERENSAILNSALVGLSRTLVDRLTAMLASYGLSAELFLTQTDGSLLGACEAARCPIMTLGSGPANSLRGAAHLTGLGDAIVMDVEAGATDTGLLVGGSPRMARPPALVGGVRTSRRLPYLISVGPGGTRAEGGAPGWLERDDHSTMTGTRWSEIAERVKTSREELPLVAVGAGAHLVPDHLRGISDVLRPEHGQVANAVGAATAEASGEIDRIFCYDEQSRNHCLDLASELAVERAVRAGADPTATRVSVLTEVPMTYTPANCARVRVRATGPLQTRI